MTTTACPVRSLTPEVREALQWFERTHEVETIGAHGPTVWRMVRYPHAGGVADQDAWLMAALAEVRRGANRLLKRPLGDADADVRTVHDEIRRSEKTPTVH